MFFLPLLLGAGVAYYFLRVAPARSGGASTGAMDVKMLPPGPTSTTPLLGMGVVSSSQPPAWEVPPPGPFETLASLASYTYSPAASTSAAVTPAAAPAQEVILSAQGSAPDVPLGTLYAAQDKTPIRSEPGLSDGFSVHAGFPMTVLHLDPPGGSGWAHVEVVHPDHGTVDGWTEMRLLTALVPSGGGEQEPALKQAGYATSKVKMKAKNSGGTVAVIDANTGAVVSQRPKLNATRATKRRPATPVAAGG